MIDPTRTTLIRYAYYRELATWLDSVYAEVMTWLDNPIAVLNAAFTPESLKAFQDWIEELLNRTIPSANASKHINKAYNKANERVYKSVTKAPLRKGETLKTELQGFQRGQGLTERLKVIHQHNFDTLQGFSDRIKMKIRNILGEELIADSSTRDIANRLREELDISKRQARTIANTEIVRSYAEGALDAMEALGVDKMQVAIEWSTAGDGRVCPKCKPLDGVILSVKDSHGMFPRHPNCRCAPIPAPDVRVRKERTQARIRKSIEAGLPSTIQRSFEAQKRREKWQGKQLLKK